MCLGQKDERKLGMLKAWLRASFSWLVWHVSNELSQLKKILKNFLWKFKEFLKGTSTLCLVSNMFFNVGETIFDGKIAPRGPHKGRLSRKQHTKWQNYPFSSKPSAAHRAAVFRASSWTEQARVYIPKENRCSSATLWFEWLSSSLSNLYCNTALRVLWLEENCEDESWHWQHRILVISFKTRSKTPFVGSLQHLKLPHFGRKTFCLFCMFISILDEEIRFSSIFISSQKKGT